MTQIVLLDIQLKKDSIEDAHAKVHETLKATREFAGNVGVSVFIDEKDPSLVIIQEEWESPADHDAYLAWRAAAATPPPLASALAGPLSTRTFTRSTAA
ncbi:MAG: monooxygenase [Frankiales bacterium]|nr:monooxygenase [Frankiales bacterium]